MQTFLPFADFKQTATCLDRQRLGKQRLEALGILETLFGISHGWKWHPAVKMWQGSESCLGEYALAICDEWIARGYKDTRKPIIRDLLDNFDDGEYVRPKWLGDERLHSSHRAALLAKLPDHYNKFGWKEEPKIDYWWPK